jgi:type IV pilus assembly protein PilE
MKRRQRGFTLIELLVALGIVAILSAIAYPSYIQYTRRGNRTDATRNMMLLAQGLERCYSQAFGCAGVPTGTANTPQGYYRITVAVPSASQFTLTAVPNGTPQSGDAPCQSFTLSSAGAQTALDSGGADNSGTCWGSN